MFDSAFAGKGHLSKVLKLVQQTEWFRDESEAIQDASQAYVRWLVNAVTPDVHAEYPDQSVPLHYEGKVGRHLVNAVCLIHFV